MTLLAILLAVAQPPPIVSLGWDAGGPPSDRDIYVDAGSGVRVRYAFTPAGVEFSAHLPAGWTFGVNVDGDQNGVWGSGPEREGVHFADPTPDRAFGQDSRNGVFCSQYVLTAFATNPQNTYSTSECGRLPSSGTVELTGFDAQMRATITLKIPQAELFGDRADAHLQVCVYDTHNWSCQHSPAAPFVLPRPAATSG